MSANPAATFTTRRSVTLITASLQAQHSKTCLKIGFAQSAALEKKISQNTKNDSNYKKGNEHNYNANCPFST